MVSANFFGETPPEIQAATDNRFTARLVKWLAGLGGIDPWDVAAP